LPYDRAGQLLAMFSYHLSRGMIIDAHKYDIIS